MKRSALWLKMLCLICTILLCLPVLAACDPGSDPETTTEDPTEAPTAEEPSNEDPSTEEPTTEEPTTEAPEPELLSSLSFSLVGEEIDLSKYFFNPNQCAATLAQDDISGKVLSLSAASTPASISLSDPYIYFQHAQLVKDLGYAAVDTREYPHLVLRVRDMGTTGQIFSMFGYANKTAAGTGVTGQLDVHVRNTDAWQYLYFDLSSYKKNLSVMRFDFTHMALADGEALYISDMMFFATAQEAEALLSPDVYPVTEQTAQDYVAKIMSFNVQTENGTSVRADIRMDMLRTLIDEYMPDSIGMQEVTTKWRDMMDTYCFNQSYASVGDPRSPGGEAGPIYYRVDKYELVDSGTFWLSDTPEVEGSAFEASQYPRICTWARLRDRVTGTEFVHLNTHLDHLGGGDGRTLRQQQFTVILKFMMQFGDLPMIVTGDLNQAAVNAENSKYAVYKTMIGERAFTLDDDTKAYSPLSNARYDAPDNMPEGVCATMTASHDPSSSSYNPAKEPIDYVLYTKASLTALSYKIRLYDRGGLYLSDHLPVICEIKFAPTPAQEEAPAE